MPPLTKAILLYELVEVAVPVARTADFTSGAIDLKNYEGEVEITLHSNNGTGNADNTLDVSVTESTATGGSYAAVATGAIAFPQVTNAAGGKLAKVIVDVRLVKRFIKLFGDIAGTSPSFIYGITLRGKLKYPSLA